jgi:hypothetical protein
MSDLDRRKEATMKTRYPDIPWLDAAYFENQRNFPLEELARYRGQHIAWSWDGSRIVASGADEQEVRQKLLAAGLDPSRVVFDYVDPL